MYAHDTHAITYLSGHERFPLELDGLERASRCEHSGTVGPRVRLFGSTLGLRGGVRKREYDRPLVVGGHFLDHRLVERLRQGGYTDKNRRLESLDGRKKIPNMLCKTGTKPECGNNSRDI